MIDHIIVGAPSLTEADEWLSATTGIQGEFGGQTPRNATHNMLYQLGGGAYLEILSPDPANLASAERGLPFGLDTLEGPTVVGWAARVFDLRAHVAKADAAEVPHGEIVEMSRTRPDGVVLEWTMTYPVPAGPAALLPVLIDWGPSEHPSTSLRHLAPLRLERFELRAPEETGIARWIDALGLADDLTVVPGAPSRYAISVAGPNGTADIGFAPGAVDAPGRADVTGSTAAGGT